MIWLARLVQLVIVTLMLQFGMYLLDVTPAYDFKEGILHFLGLITIMMSPDIGGAFYRAIRDSRGNANSAS